MENDDPQSVVSNDNSENIGAPYQSGQSQEMTTPLPEAHDTPREHEQHVGKNLASANRLAKLRTSEFMIGLLAVIAVRLAITSNKPREQDGTVKTAELRYMNRLWSRYAARELS